MELPQPWRSGAPISPPLARISHTSFLQIGCLAWKAYSAMPNRRVDRSGGRRLRVLRVWVERRTAWGWWQTRQWIAGLSAALGEPVQRRLRSAGIGRERPMGGGKDGLIGTA